MKIVIIAEKIDLLFKLLNLILKIDMQVKYNKQIIKQPKELVINKSLNV